ncbi:hypothetical protein FFONT_0073 [Fervidicoccus fontis Kam940]|uniref:Uncharacterized protein n=1 Tax=Fervidicoccus fontis (strain DSM 19380 / JCM 18336 / VKM B-2539 / Kam940) TaxID=1163730 RepID=H9ZZB0_FERFK|nr:hypothetical protein FFONT_0073 [Fervidicoccus fontis Kam940]
MNLLDRIESNNEAFVLELFQMNLLDRIERLLAQYQLMQVL